MLCPFCDQKTKTYNSRRHIDGLRVWRRRKCTTCSEAFTTYEHLDLSFLMIAKKSGETESYARAKLWSSIYRAHLHPIESELLTDNIERRLIKLQRPLVTTVDLAKLAAQSLKAFSKASWARYSSFQ